MQIILTEEEYNALKGAETAVIARVKAECDRRMDIFFLHVSEKVKIRQDESVGFSRHPYCSLVELKGAVDAARALAKV